MALVSKLRAILLMEADFNMFNRIIFGNRMLDLAHERGLIPDEQYAAKESDAQDGVLQKVLFADIARQARLPGAIVSAEAAHCYDRIAHPFASLVFQLLAVPLACVTAMLSCIQCMKFFLWTAFGNSTIFMAAAAGSIFQGMCQGNTASPAAWSAISALFVRAYKRRGQGMRHHTPISRRPFDSAGILFVDDTDPSRSIGL